MVDESTDSIGHEVSAGSTMPATVRLTPAGRAWLSIGAAAVFALTLVFWLWISWKAIKTPLGQVDFPSYFVAARVLRHNPHANIYDPLVINPVAHALGLQWPPPYIYTVLPALLLTPLTVLPFITAVRIWLALNAVLVVLCMLVLALELRHYLAMALNGAGAAGRGTGAALWTRATADPALLLGLAVAGLLCFTSRPTTWALGLGQIDFLVLLPLALVPWLTRHGHERWVGVCIGLAVMIKITPAVLLAYLLLRRRWEALVAALATLALLALACIVVVGPHLFFAIIGVLCGGGLSDAAAGINESLFGPLANLVIEAHPALVGVVRLGEYAVLAIVALVIGWVLWRAPRVRLGRVSVTGTAGIDTEMAAYALALCPIVLLSPVAWAHHYMWLLPAAIVMLGLAARAWLLSPRERPAGLTPTAAILVLLLLAALLLVLPLPYGWDTDPRLPTRFVLGLDMRLWLQQLRPLGGLLLAIIAGFWALRVNSARSQAPAVR